MRVVLYSHHALFEPAISLVDALASRAEVHLLLEVPSGAWRTASFEAMPQEIGPGLVDADAVLAPFYPDAVRQMWRKAASFHLVSHGGHRTRHPRSLRVTLEVLRWIRKLEPDILHVDDVDVAPRVALGLALTRQPFPVLMGCHDPDPHSGERQWQLKRFTRLLAFPASAAFLVHHQAGKAALLRRHPRLRRPVHIVRLGSYAFMRELAPTSVREPSADSLNVLLFGRITPYKGLADLFRAAPLVAAEVPGARFVVAGNPVEGYTPPEPPRLPNGATVECRYGYIPNTSVGDLFSEAQVAVCPYTDASQSGVVLTAYAFGCPVVVTDVGGLPEYVVEGTTGLVVPPHDHEQLAAALIRCLSDTGLVTRMAEGVAAVTASELSWQRAGSELLGVYTAIQSGRRRRRGRRRGRHR